MNTIRSIQWALKNQSEAKGATFCTGTVGNDKNADRMHSAADYAGVAVKYFKVNEAFEDQKVHRDSGNCSENSSSSSSMSDITSNNLFNAGSNSSHSNPKCNLPTGCCAVLITENGQNRSLITNLAAAKIYPKKFLKSIWEERIETAKYFYAPGFFLSTENNQGLETLKMVGEHCLEKNKVFITNISAPFVCTVFKKELAEIISYADVVFGNDFEYLAWGAANPDIVPEDKREDLKFINTCVANMPKADKSKPRLAITTRGDKSTLISQGEKCFEIPIHVVPEKELVDTNGAGDAFVAGFMCGLIYNQSIIDCLDSANKVATSIIKMPGCTFPQESLLKF